MIKAREISDKYSCLSKAKDDELIFVLLGRDPAAPAAIRAWAAERIKLGKNQADDQQLIAALAAADAMDANRDYWRASNTA